MIFRTFCKKMSEILMSKQDRKDILNTGEVTMKRRRGQIVTMPWRAVGSPAPQNTANPFTDVLEGKYYYDAVLWAVENRVTTGTAATRFSPNETCTHTQIVTFCGGIWERLRRRSRLLPLRI